MTSNKNHSLWQQQYKDRCKKEHTATQGTGTAFIYSCLNIELQ